ncbi:TetR family transcriptional regulator [Nocardia sp. ET3-3]|uniref:TetR family transcriptional regulator n=1 Tax=Nocardia terrae TaxID=2675851 RepID=A0A7K1UX93_9NOCA|nr:TetR/AcrR family transcriptional regulator C-terminal domain-containing protein [Nocardia terrae]MVU78809.1 TetR family transcriptional regulator [Nocardia terrae]
MTTPIRRGRPPKGESRLSREAIVRATLQAIAADGIAAISMRTVGRALGVDAKSLYNHVDGKDGLLDAVTEYLLGAIDLPARSGDFRADLLGIARAFRARALAHPEVAALVLTRQLASFEALAPIEAVLTILRDAGCAPAESVHLLRAFLATLIGTLLREVNAGPTYGTADIDAIAHRRSVLESSGLPAVAAAAPHLARFDRDTEFDFAMTLALDALTARLQRRPGPPPATGGDPGLVRA